MLSLNAIHLKTHCWHVGACFNRIVFCGWIEKTWLLAVSLGLLAKIWNESCVNKDLFLDMNLTLTSFQGQCFSVHFVVLLCLLSLLWCALQFEAPVDQGISNGLNFVMLMKSWVLVPCEFVGRCWHFRETCCCHLQGLKWHGRKVEGLYRI
jgi:hypothetical protein